MYSNYRSIISVQGKGFSEAKTQEILRQVLPQLAQLHSMGQVHGAISLDTIFEINNVATLSAPFTSQSANNLTITKDISDLGQVLAELLTGKIGIRDNLDDHCMVSDQTLELITAMMQNSLTSRFRTVTDIQGYSNNVPTPQPAVYPVPAYIPIPTNVQYSQPTQTQDNIRPFFKKNAQTIIAIASGLTMGLVAVGIFLAINNSSKNLQPVAISPEPQVVSTPDPSITVPPQPQTVTTPAPASIQPESIGWIRIGAVRNTSGYAAVGNALISTTQPVTISPMVVPALKDRVITISGVNLRDDAPKPPLYKIGRKVSTLLANQKLQILNLKTFVDNNSSSPYTIVWAEVRLP